LQEEKWRYVPEHNFNFSVVDMIELDENVQSSRKATAEDVKRNIMDGYGQSGVRAKAPLHFRLH
jgi:hypothetical protein